MLSITLFTLKEYRVTCLHVRIIILHYSIIVQQDYDDNVKTSNNREELFREADFLIFVATFYYYGMLCFLYNLELESNVINKHFISGEDPLADDQNERDINSVAGVLKLYFRGLENPLFPKERFQDLISTISK